MSSTNSPAVALLAESFTRSDPPPGWPPCCASVTSPAVLVDHEVHRGRPARHQEAVGSRTRADRLLALHIDEVTAEAVRARFTPRSLPFQSMHSTAASPDDLHDGRCRAGQCGRAPLGTAHLAVDYRAPPLHQELSVTELLGEGSAPALDAGIRDLPAHENHQDSGSSRPPVGSQRLFALPTGTHPRGRANSLRPRSANCVARCWFHLSGDSPWQCKTLAAL